MANSGMQAKPLPRIGTWWWNVRFDLGVWVGGFDQAHRDYFATKYAKKLWGHGRLRQIAQVVGCKLRGGHAWRDWSETVRTCKRGCGAVQYGGPPDEQDAYGCHGDTDYICDGSCAECEVNQ